MQESQVHSVDVKPKIIFLTGDGNSSVVDTMLTVEGYEVVTVVENDTAENSSSCDFDLLLVDASVSDDVWEWLQHEELKDGIPVILLMNGSEVVVDACQLTFKHKNLTIVPYRKEQILVEVQTKVMDYLLKKKEKRLEEQAHRQDIQELTQMNRKLRRMYQDLQLKLEAQKNYHATIAHELGTSVTLIHTYLQMVQDGTIDPNDHEYAEIVLDKIVVLSRLIGDLQELSMIEKEETGVRLENIKVSDWLIRVHHSIDFTLKQAGRQFSWKVIGEIDEQSMILLDFSRMDQVIQNLLSNAIKHTEDGVGRIDVVVHRDSDLQQLTIQIADNGIGIRAEDLPYLFKRYFKGSARREGDSDRGAGLGLAIVHEIIEGHNGRIDVRSQLGEGAEFTIHLPLMSS